MDLSHYPIDKILQALQERAKELHCLYQVDEILGHGDAPPEEIFRALIQVIPAGYQYPSVCMARITWEDGVFQPSGLEETPWVQTAPFVVHGRAVGKVEVFYGRPMPKADEGPFPKEERKLIDTIAERVAHHLAQRDLQSTLREWHSATAGRTAAPGPAWWLIIDFLRHTVCETYNSYDAGLYLLKTRIASALQSPMVIIVININPTIDNIACHLRKSNI